jgi:succinyl-CoA synthetase alpha subunit
MITRNLIQPNRYQDSVTLMQVAERVRARDGITAAALMMGTPPNKELLQDAGQLTADGESAGPNDLIIALQGHADAVAAVEAEIDDLLRAEIPAPTDRAAAVPHSLAAGFAAAPASNFVLISTPGLYAAAEARKALLAGRHVMIFSDNVRLDDEESLKRLAGERGLLLMGPDCGTAIIGGVPLGFANAVRRGPIGVVGASGTGTQEVTTLIVRYGSGVSLAIGTGRRDLSQRIGGAMTIAGLQALLADPATEVVVVLSKPPHPTVAARVAQAAAHATKPVVFAFLGMDPAALPGDHPHIAHTLEAAARQAVQLAGGTPPPEDGPDTNPQSAIRNPQYVRGLFSGGTFAYEAMLILQAAVGPVYSNIPLRPEDALPDPAHSREHTVLDLGADEFTVGRPHPMIDLSVRAARIRAEAADPTTGVILLDVVLGYGAHPDPASGLADAIRAARATAAAAGRDLAVVASVCGTEADPQRLSAQQAQLAAAGVRLAPSNAAAARLALRVLSAEC